MRRTVAIAVVAGCSLVGACSDPPPPSQTATPPAVAPGAPVAAPAKPDPLIAFEQTPFCKKFGCKREKSWPLKEGGINNTYTLSAAPDVSLDIVTEAGSIDGYGVSLYERKRLPDQDLTLLYDLLRSIHPAGGSPTARHLIQTYIERPVEQIKRSRSAHFGPYTVWAGKVGGTQTVSVERATEPAGTSANVPVPLRDAGGVPPDFRDLWKAAASGGKAGKHGDYTYQYAAAGDRAAAVMLPRPIPRDDTILVATIGDFARRVFRADLSSATPRLEPTPHGNAIAFTVSPFTYYVLTIKNETREGAYGPGEPHTLLLWRER